MKAVDLSRIQTIQLEARPHKVVLEGFARPPGARKSFSDFLSSLPRLFAAEDLQAVARSVVAARKHNRPVVVGLGGHVVKCGLNPILIDFMERGIITALAMNGSAAIHDFEIALVGQTSEDVAAGLKSGTFGMVRETGELMNRGINRALDHPQRGMGDLLAGVLEETRPPYQSHSLLVAARRLGIPLTVHVAIGTDTIHMHPTANGAAIGRATFNDFRLFAGIISALSGGVYLNLGSAVVMPEVFLKAFTVAQNLGADLRDFVTVNMDMTLHYRPGENVVRRPPSVGGRGYSLQGRHEIMIPLLAQAIVEQMEFDGPLTGESATAQVPLRHAAGKTPAWDELIAVRERHRRDNKKVVWTNGCFDLLHAGHVRTLRAARAFGDILVVGVNDDDSVRALKGPGRPIISQRERVELLAALECVDYVVLFSECTPDAALLRLKPDVHCKGGDYAPPNGKPVPEAALVQSYGGRVEFLPLVPGISTTDIVREVRGRS
jgi:rfaE bifunctional protein nucleotidyltransferase chain/domain